MEERKSQYKKAIGKGEERLQKRVDQTNRLQKENRDKAVSSKRVKRASDNNDNNIENDNSNGNKVQFSQADILLALQQLQKHDASALRQVRRILSVEDPPIDLVLAPVNNNNVIADIVHFLKSGDEIQQMDAAWCITNLATGTHEQTALLLPSSPYLIQHLSGNNESLVEQCAWALGNLSADCLEFRDVLRSNGILHPLVSILHRYTTSNSKKQRQAHSLARTAAFALANQARGQNPKLEQIMELNIAPIISRILSQHVQHDHNAMSDAGDETNIVTEVQIEVAWVLTYLTAHVANIKQIAEAGLLPLLINHLNSHVTALVIPVLRSVGNIISRSDEMTDLLLHPSTTPHLLPILRNLLSSEHRAIVKEAAYVLSNIAGGPQGHVDNLVATPGMVASIAATLRVGQFDIAREAAYAICNIASNSSRHIEKLVTDGVVVGMLHLLSSSDSEVAHLALTFTEMVLKFHPQGPSIIQQEDGIEKLEALQFHNNHELYKLANQLIDEYYGEEFEDSEPIDNEPQVEYPSWRVRQ